MAFTYAHLLDAQREHSRAFGQMLRRWRVANGWTQYTAEDWSIEAGFIKLGHGTMSELENGKLRSPGLKAFAFLYEVNRRLVAQDWSGVKSPRLRELLIQGRPILDEQGQPWSIEGWWAVHKGLQPIPDWLSSDPQPTVNDAKAAELCGRWVAGLREVALASGAGPGQLSNAYQLAPAEHQQRWHEVLLGMRPYSGEELTQLWDSTAEDWLPVTWVRAWTASLEPAPSGGGGGAKSTFRLEPA